MWLASSLFTMRRWEQIAEPHSVVSQKNSIATYSSEVNKLARFIDQFFDVIQEWSRRTASSDEDIRLYVMTSVGCFDEEEDSEFNLSMLEARLKFLVDDIHLSESFLVVALMQEIEKIFEDQLEDAYKGGDSKGVIRVRGVKQKFIEDTPKQEHESPSFQKRMKMLDDFERSIFPSVGKVAQRKFFLDTWREVTVQIKENDKR
jgi:hypothetical protein